MRIVSKHIKQRLEHQKLCVTASVRFSLPSLVTRLMMFSKLNATNQLYSIFGEHVSPLNFILYTYDAQIHVNYHITNTLFAIGKKQIFKLDSPNR